MSDTISFKDAQAFISEGSLDFPFNLKLKKPIVLGSETKDYVSFNNEPTAGDISSLPVSDYKFGDFFPVLSKVIGEPIVVVNKLSIGDMKNCMEILNHFLVDSEEDGNQV